MNYFIVYMDNLLKFNSITYFFKISSKILKFLYKKWIIDFLYKNFNILLDILKFLYKKCIIDFFYIYIYKNVNAHQNMN